MSAAAETIRFDWHGISVSVEFRPEWGVHRELYGYPMTHLQIRREDGGPLPITETGYRSHFMAGPVIEEAGGPEAFVRDWLDSYAKGKTWRKAQADWRQPSLF